MKRPFWLHQLVEYLLGVALVSQGLQSTKPAIPTVVGLAVLVNVAVARGPLSAFPRVPRPVHRILDLVLLGAVVLGALATGDLVRPTMRWVMLGVAAAYAFVIWTTDYRVPVRRAPTARGTRPAARRVRATPPTEPSTVDRSAGDRSGELGRRAGRVTGQLYNAARRRKRS
jgi:hypothetical protein